jgi:acyl-CoA reductase-like NAD-dependent aldehyde dehydrogenase
MSIDYRQLYIGGQWSDPAKTETIDVHSPTTEEQIGSVPRGSETDVDTAVAAARAAFDDPDGWPTWSPAQRGEVLERFAAELEARGEETARRVSMQNGMPIWLAHQFEAGFPPLLLRYYSGLMNSMPAEDARPGMLGGTALVSRQPVGVVAAITPWNVPQGISFLKIAPALAAGCTMVLKPAEETVLDAFLMAEAALAAGLPVLTSTSSGAAELVRLGENGERVDALDIPAIAAAGHRLLEAMHDPARSEEFRNASRASVAHMSNEAMAAQLVALYRQLLAATTKI